MTTFETPGLPETYNNLNFDSNERWSGGPLAGDFLFRTRRFFMPTQLSSLFNPQIRPYLEYGSHLRRGASKISWIQFRGELIGGELMLPTPWTIVELHPFYRYCRGVCYDGINSIITPIATFTGNTRFENIQHPIMIKLLAEKRIRQFVYLYDF